MDPKEYQNTFENEEKHFFYVANHRIIISLVEKYLQTNRKKTKILDAGCGTGLLATKLARFGDVVGIDKNQDAVKFTKSRGIKVKAGSISDIPFPTNYFDLVVCIDVLNHQWVEDDETALAEFFRVLKPGGVLILRVSANPYLRLKHDRYVFIKFRYRKKALWEKIEKAGFKIEKISFVNAILLPVAILKQFGERFEQKKTSSTIFSLPSLVNKTLAAILSLETYLLKKFNLPFGIALIAVSRKNVV